MPEVLIAALVLLVLRSLYKTFVEPGWMKSQTRKIWRGEA